MDIITVHPMKKLPSSQISDISHLMHVLKKLMQPNSVIFVEKRNLSVSHKMGTPSSIHLI